MHLSSDNNLDRNCNLLSLVQIGSEKGLSVSTSKVLKGAQNLVHPKSQFTNVKLD